MKLSIVLPAFNEASVISQVIKSLPKRIERVSKINILVVDDGSTDQTSTVASKHNVEIVKHCLNRGLGAAIKTGLTWAKNNQTDILVTFDADGQHNSKDIEKIIKPILTNKAEIVIGSRFKKKQDVPLDRFILNWCANLITFLLFGILSTDSQSGLRAFSKKAIESIDFKADRMEFSSEILLEAKKHKLRIAEVPVKALYTDYSRKKGQKNTNAFPIFARFLVRFLR